MTLFVVLVLGLVSLITAKAVASTSAQNSKVVMKAEQLSKESEIPPEIELGTEVLISRSTTLYDHQDGTRKDSMDYLFVPSLKTSFGSLKAKIIYSQDLRDDSATASDWGDIPVTWALIPNKWRWSPPYVISITPFFSAVIPASQNSLVRDELKTAVSAGASFGIIPDGIAPTRDGTWSLAIAISAGQNIHSYSTDINGTVLNKYSSNQILNLSYIYKRASFSLEYINKSRWTYEGNAKNSFEHSEEIGFAVTDHFSTAIGHSNAGTALRANALDSNLDFINENDSLVYLALGLSF